MKNSFLLVFILVFSTNVFSQESKISFELNYPIPTGDNFIGKGFNGIIDLGVDYKLANLNPITIGVSVNGGILTNNSNGLKVKSYMVQPRIFGELNLESISKIHPAIGIGYTVLIFDVSDPIDVENPDNETGFNLNFGISYDITKKLFTQIQYDFIKFNKEDDTPNTKFNRNVSVLKVGLGYRF